MGVKIVYLDEATQDLRSIYKYISRDSIKYAVLEVKKIRSFINSLANFPFKGKYFETRRGKEMFSIVYRNYIIFYTVSDIRISILTTHHHARLITNNPAFKDEE